MWITGSEKLIYVIIKVCGDYDFDPATTHKPKCSGTTAGDFKRKLVSIYGPGGLSVNDRLKAE